MGVHNLWELLAPVGRRVSVEALGNKKLAVDASIWIVQFMKAMRDDRGDMVRNAHLLGFFRRICKLLYLRVKPVFVFDGATPALKRRTVVARRRLQENARAKLRKTAEKLLLNHLRTRHLEEASMEAKRTLLRKQQQQQQQQVEVEQVEVEQVEDRARVPEEEAALDSLPYERLESDATAAQQPDKESAQSSDTGIPPAEAAAAAAVTAAMASSPMHLQDTTIVPESVAGTSADTDQPDQLPPDFIADDDDDETEELLLLPSVQAQLDPSVLASLPPSMQLNLLVQMREQLVADNRQKFQRVAKAPASFSELQIQAYLKTVAFRREINEVQQAAAGKIMGGVSSARIASETSREYIFSSAFSGEKKQYLELSQRVSSTGDQNELSTEPGVGEVPYAYSTSTRTRLRYEEFGQGGDGCSTSEPSHLRGVQYGTRIAHASVHKKAHHRANNASKSAAVDPLTSPLSLEFDYLERLRKGKAVCTDGDEEEEVRLMAPSTPTNMRVSFVADEGGGGGGETSRRSGSEDEAILIASDEEEQDGVTTALAPSQPANLTVSFVADDGSLEDGDDDIFKDLFGGDSSRVVGIGNSPGRRKNEDGGNVGQTVQLPRVDAETTAVAASDRDVEVDTHADTDADDEVEWEDGTEDTLVHDSNAAEVGSDEPLLATADPVKTSATDEQPQIVVCDMTVRSHRTLSDRGVDGVHADTDADEVEWEDGTEDTRAHDSSAAEIDGNETLLATAGPVQTSATDEQPEMVVSDMFVRRSSRTSQDQCQAGEIGVKLFGQGSRQEQPTAVREPSANGKKQPEADQAGSRRQESVEQASRPEQAPHQQEQPAANEEPFANGKNQSEEDQTGGLRKGAEQGFSGRQGGEQLGRALNGESSIKEQSEADAQTLENVPVLVQSGSEPNNRGISSVDGFGALSGSHTHPQFATVQVRPQEGGQEHAGSSWRERVGEQADHHDVQNNLQDMAADMDELLREQSELREALQANERNADSVTGEMFAECQELLQMFGLPYIIAPMEAEAQCAYMDLAGLVDGVVTNDSDVFLFGGENVYRNIFDDRKYVETYFIKDIVFELGLTREKLIQMALLLGSDYTEGVSGIGIVNAIELVNAFTGEEELRLFREWLESPDASLLKKIPGKSKKRRRRSSGMEDEDADNADDVDLEADGNVGGKNYTAAQLQFMEKHRAVSKNWNLPDSFPSNAVLEAYRSPQVDDSKETFSWGRPDLAALRKVCFDGFGWNQSKADELLLPVLKEYDRHETQLRLDSFYSFNQRFAKIRSTRIQKAVSSITGKKLPELMHMESAAEEEEEGETQTQGTQTQKKSRAGSGARKTTTPTRKAPARKAPARTRKRKAAEEARQPPILKFTRQQTQQVSTTGNARVEKVSSGQHVGTIVGERMQIEDTTENIFCGVEYESTPCDMESSQAHACVGGPFGGQPEEARESLIITSSTNSKKPIVIIPEVDITDLDSVEQQLTFGEAATTAGTNSSFDLMELPVEEQPLVVDAGLKAVASLRRKRRISY